MNENIIFVVSLHIFIGKTNEHTSLISQFIFLIVDISQRCFGAYSATCLRGNFCLRISDQKMTQF